VKKSDNLDFPGEEGKGGEENKRGSKGVGGNKKTQTRRNNGCPTKRKISLG